MKKSKIDFKTIFIIILSFGLILSFIFGQRSKIDYKKDELKGLHKKNEELSSKNDSLRLINGALGKQLVEVDKQIQASESLLVKTELKLNNLKQKRNETSNRVNKLSPTGVSIELSNFIERQKSPNR